LASSAGVGTGLQEEQRTAGGGRRRRRQERAGLGFGSAGGESAVRACSLGCGPWASGPNVKLARVPAPADAIVAADVAPSPPASASVRRRLRPCLDTKFYFWGF